MWWHYLIWIPVVAAFYIGYGWLSIKNNQFGGSWFAYLYLYGGIVQLWAVVSRISKNIKFDAILYDLIMMIGCMVALVFWDGHKITPIQILGICLAITGLMLLR